MAKRITEDKIQEIVKLYEEGKNFTYIAKLTGISTDTISKHLRLKGIIYKRNFDRLTEDERLDICNLYLENKWDEILKKYKFMTKNKVYHLTSEMGVKKKSYFWSKEDEYILIKNYGLSYTEISKIMGYRHSAKAISKKAIKMGLTHPQEWTDDEIGVLKQYYSHIPKEDFLKLLPHRTESAIICKAMQLKLKSYHYLNEKYSDKEKQFIIDNYKYMTDVELSKTLDKPLSGIQEQRRKLGIYYLNKDYSGYENMTKFFRGHIQDWKNNSIEHCTGSKDFEVHHIYSINMIVKETFESLDKIGKLKTDNIEDYSKKELDDILQLFLCIHSRYPLGVCVKRDIHALFHRIYGSGGNTEIQWKQFVNDYNNHKYDKDSEHLIHTSEHICKCR